MTISSRYCRELHSIKTHLGKTFKSLVRYLIVLAIFIFKAVRFLQHVSHYIVLDCMNKTLKTLEDHTRGT